MSIILSLSKSDGDTAYLTNQYNPPIYIGGSKKTNEPAEWEVALIKAHMWYSYYNISASLYQNNILTYIVSGTPHNVVIPDGMYTVENINSLLLIDLQTNSFYDPSIDPVPPCYIYPNYQTIRVELVPIDPTFSFDLSTSRLWYILGFTQAQTVAPITTRTAGLSTANITNDINELQIRCSLLDGSGGSYTNSDIGNVLYSFVPSTPPGSSIEVAITERVYAPIQSFTEQIRDIAIEITDQNGRRIGFNQEDVSVLLHLRRVA